MDCGYFWINLKVNVFFHLVRLSAKNVLTSILQNTSDSYDQNVPILTLLQEIAVTDGGHESQIPWTKRGTVDILEENQGKE